MERIVISLLVILSLVTYSVHAEDGDGDHGADTPAAEETAPPARAETKDPAAKEQSIVTRPEALVKAIQGMKLSRQAATELQLLLEKNPDLTPKQFNDTVDLLADQEPTLLTPEQIQGLKELFRVELTNVPKDRSAEMAKALKTIVAKLPAPPGEATANAAAVAAGTVPPAGGSAAVPDITKAFSEQLSKATAAQQASLGQVLEGARALLGNLQKVAQDTLAKGDPNEKGGLLGKLKEQLEKGINDKNGKNDRADRDRGLDKQNDFDRQPPGRDSASDDGKKDRGDSKNDRLLDFLKKRDKDKDKPAPAQSSNNNGGEKKDDRKDKKEEQKPEAFKRKEEDPPPPPKKKATTTPAPTPAPEEPVAEAPPPAAPRDVSPLSPIQNQGGGGVDSGMFNFGGGAMPSGGGGSPMPGGTAFDGGVFNLGGEDFGGFGGGMGRAGFAKGVGYAASGDPSGGGGDGEETVDGGGGTEEPARSGGGGRRGAPSQEIVMTPPSEGLSPAMAMVGSLVKKRCEEDEESMGVCQAMKARRQRRLISQEGQTR